MGTVEDEHGRVVHRGVFGAGVWPEVRLQPTALHVPQAVILGGSLHGLLAVPHVGLPTRFRSAPIAPKAKLAARSL